LWHTGNQAGMIAGRRSERHRAPTGTIPVGINSTVRVITPESERYRALGRALQPSLLGHRFLPTISIVKFTENMFATGLISVKIGCKLVRSRKTGFTHLFKNLLFKFLDKQTGEYRYATKKWRPDRFPGHNPNCRLRGNGVPLLFSHARYPISDRRNEMASEANK
jgi:hypothetical protein